MLPMIRQVPSRRLRRFPVRVHGLVTTLLIGVTLLAAASACGPAGSPGASPTATRAPTTTPTPAVCSTWRLIPSSNPATPPESSLSAVSALSSTAAWAVGGAFYEGDGVQSLIEQWDGSTWKMSANAGTDFLRGVVALSANDVWAVGSMLSSQNATTRVTLVEHWNGATWNIIASPNPGSPDNALNSIAAVAPNDLWAVGGYNTSSGRAPLIERWDGANWSVVESPALDAVQGELFAVARIPSSRQFWAVGSLLKAPRPSYEQPLIERWDGAAWQVVPSPALPQGALGGILKGVTAVSATEAWAVGNYTASNHTLRAFIAHWNGSDWSLATSPNIWGTLNSVAATRSSNVQAVGLRYFGGTGSQHALIMRWNGSMWQVAISPEPTGTGYSTLDGISADGASGFWAVGSARNAATRSQTFIARCA